MSISRASSFSAPPGPLSKMSLSRALKFDNAPSRTPTVLIEMKFESSRALLEPSSARMPALYRCPVTMLWVIVMDGALASSAPRATRVSPGEGLKAAPETVSAGAGKLVPANVTALRLPTNVDCCRRSDPPSTETAYAAAPVQLRNELFERTTEPALVARTHASNKVATMVSFTNVKESLVMPTTPANVLSKRDA